MSEQQFQQTVMDELRQQQENDMETTNRFQELFEKNVNDKTEARNGLTYLSWSWAWAEFKKFYPNAHYEVAKTAQGLPYFESDAGAMVYTVVTAGGCTHEMWLPVMDGKKCLGEILRVNPNAKVIIASGFPESGQSDNARTSGSRGFVGKPYNMRKLLNTVREILDKN